MSAFLHWKKCYFRPNYSFLCRDQSFQHQNVLRNSCLRKKYELLALKIVKRANTKSSPTLASALLETIVSTDGRDDLWKEDYIRIGKSEVHFITYGRGPHVLLFTYGVLGEISNSFKMQLKAFDPYLFTSIFWDPPGYGKSFPRGRNFIPYTYIDEDVDTAHALLAYLNISSLTLFGWCDGAHMSIAFSCKYPNMVNKLIIWGSKSYLTSKNKTNFHMLRSLSNWSSVSRREVMKAYNNDVNYILTVINQYVDMIETYGRKFNGNVFDDLLPFVNVPVLIFHSIDDVMVSNQQIQHLRERLQYSSYHQFSTGGHHCHIKHYNVFNEISSNFIVHNFKFS